MRDLIYLNYIYESIEEGVGIKTTKLKQFYDRATGYESHKNPNTEHQELRNPSRRSVKYDYGKANYEEISAEEAIRLVKQDKNNIQNLRIIYRLNDPGSLVEYEVRNNGSVYAIYGSPNEITIGDKTYKNIRYAPWKKVLENADLIYLTDEYDRYLDADPEVAKARADRNNFVQLPLPADRNADNFDPHNIYVNAYSNGSTQPYGAPARYAQLNIDTGAHDVAKRFNPTVAATLQPYINAKRDVKAMYDELDRHRRALRKLEVDKDELDEDEYLRKKELWTDAYNSKLKVYRDYLMDLHKIEAKVEKAIDAKSAAFVEKLRMNILEYSRALKQGFELSEKIGRLKATLTGDLATAADTGDSELRRAASALQSSAQGLLDAKRALQDIINSGDTYKVTDAENRVMALAISFDEKLKAVDQIKSERLLKKYLEDINTIAEKLKEIDVKLAELRPKTAAAANARAAKNRQVELEPDVANLIDFVDDEENSEE